MTPRLWLLSYDIADPRRLGKISKWAIRHGERIQKSLYSCPLSPEALSMLHHRLADALGPGDRVMLRPLCRSCRERTRTQGMGSHPERHEPFWIV